MNKTYLEILQLLQQQQGNPLSGEEIATKLAISRTAVWKAIKKLREQGIAITGITKKGYILDKKADLFSKETIQPLRTDTLEIEIDFFEQVTSTNTLAKEYASRASIQKSKLFVAAEQTQGRGRLGRSFYSPNQTGVYMSLCLFPQQSLDSIPLFTIQAAVALYKTIHSLSPNEQLGIKWVNDIWLGHKKVAGILTEAVTDIQTQQVSALIIGLGVNVHMPTHLPDELASIVTGFQTEMTVSRSELVARFLHEWEKTTTYSKQTLIQLYKQHSIILNQDIIVYSGQHSYTATALDIGENGELLIQTADGEYQELTYGEVSIRPFK